MVAIAICLTIVLNIVVLEADGPKNTNPAILVQFRSDISERERLAVIQEIGGELTDWIAPLHIARVSMQRPNLESNGADERIINAAALGVEHPAIHFAEPDALVVSGLHMPNDPDFSVLSRSYAQQLINLPLAWDHEQGISDVVIAVLDTGVALTHIEFVGRLVSGKDLVNGDDDPNDDHGHGTHIAGIIVANIDNEAGLAGVCPACMLMPIKVLDENNLGAWSTIARGITFAVDNGANVINLSLGSTQPSQTVKHALQYAHDHGVLIVAAAGNQGSSDLFYPAAYPNVLAVAATNQRDERWALSNYGDYIDIAAPGDNIYSTAAVDTNPPNGYSSMGGTSMAAPFVAGLAGLILSQEPSRTVPAVIEIIQNSAIDLGEEGKDQIFGHGRIDIERALAGEGEGPEGTHKRNFIYLPIVNKGR